MNRYTIPVYIWIVLAAITIFSIIHFSTHPFFRRVIETKDLTYETYDVYDQEHQTYYYGVKGSYVVTEGNKKVDFNFITDGCDCSNIPYNIQDQYKAKECTSAVYRNITKHNRIVDAQPRQGRIAFYILFLIGFVIYTLYVFIDPLSDIYVYEDETGCGLAIIILMLVGFVWEEDENHYRTHFTRRWIFSPKDKYEAAKRWMSFLNYEVPSKEELDTEMKKDSFAIDNFTNYVEYIKEYNKKNRI